MRRQWLMFALVIVLLSPVCALSQTTYPLVCRGGGDLHFTYTPFSNLSPQPQVWIMFTRAPQGVGLNQENLAALQPGQCAWLDRAISANEPDTIAVLNVKEFSIQWQHGRVAGISSSLPYLSSLLDEGQYETFNAYNNGNGYFIATHQ